MHRRVFDPLTSDYILLSVFRRSLACSMLAMIFDCVSATLVLSIISCSFSGGYCIIPYLVGLLDSLLYGYNRTWHSSHSWFQLICFEQRLIMISWSWSSLLHIANHSIQLFWYFPILVQTFNTNLKLFIPISNGSNLRRSIDIFCFGAILDFENSRFTSAFPSYNVFK